MLRLTHFSKLIAAGTLAALLVPSAAFADSRYSGQAAKDRRLGLIAETEWNLRHSSIATVIDKSVQDKSIQLLDKARQHVSLGELRKADDLIEQAAEPLHRMTPEAMAGKHPDLPQSLAVRRDTLASITAGGEKIAREKGVTATFVGMAEAAQERSRALEREGRIDKALEVIDQAYLSVQREIARLRDGQEFYLAIADRPADQQWSDSLRRFEERRQLTEMLISEAKAEGIDAAPLLSGLQEADRLHEDATRLADGQRWDKAVQSLEIAYLRFEDSWRQVGLEW